MKFYQSVKQRVLAKARSVLDSPIIKVDELVMGEGVKIGRNVEINCRRLVLGDGVSIDSGTRIEMTDLVIGDYTHINSNCLFTGDDWCRIGHNCWFGHYSIVNSTGTAQIGNGVGVGAHSQLWSHIYFGDILEGCRFASRTPIVIEDDVWFVGHCIVSPIRAKKSSMAMVGSVITRDMDENHVYAGVPAKDMTERFGPQFVENDLETKRNMMNGYLEQFLKKYKPSVNRIRIVDRINAAEKELSQFSLMERVYLKHLYPEEMRFIRFLTPTKAKFNPHPETDWISHYMSIQSL